MTEKGNELDVAQTEILNNQRYIIQLNICITTFATYHFVQQITTFCVHPPQLLKHFYNKNGKRNPTTLKKLTDFYYKYRR